MFFLVLIIGFFTYDLSDDFKNNAPAIHIVVDFIMGFTACSGVVMAWFYLRQVRGRLTSQLSQALEEAQVKSLETELLKSGVSAAIDSEFEKWELTHAEKEVGLLLLKGLSLKEITVLRETAERTVRHQTLSIYDKSGLSGRAELSAYFLEDLL